MAAEFNITDLIAEVTSGQDTTTNVQVASGSVSESKAGSGH
jgi:hypothetical protein